MFLPSFIALMCLGSSSAKAAVYSPSFLSPASWLALLEPTSSASTDFGVKFLGKDPFQNREEEEFRPASTAKVITAAAALDRLGENYQFETRVQWRVDPARPGHIADLTFFGSGDPSWGLSELGETPQARMRELALHLSSLGVKEIEGSIQFLSSDDRWNTAGVPPGWDRYDLVNCYGAVARAYNVGLNCMPYVVTGATTGHWADQRIPDFIDVQVRVSSAGTSLWTEGLANGKFRVRGRVAPGKSGVIGIPVVGVAQWLERMLSTELANLKIQRVPEVNRGFAGNRRRALRQVLREYTLKSPPLKRILQPFLKFSFNLIGEALLLKMGESSAPSGAVSFREAGLQSVNDFLAGHHVRDGISLADGSGLSRNTHLRPIAFHSLLEKLKSTSTFPSLVKALSIAGVDGTLRNRMIGTLAQRTFVGKSGSLDGVATVVGYFPWVSASGVRDWLTVLILGRTTQSSTASLRQGADRVITKLVNLHRGNSVRASPRGFTGFDPDLIELEPAVSALPNPFESYGLSYDPRSPEGVMEHHESALPETNPADPADASTDDL